MLTKYNIEKEGDQKEPGSHHSKFEEIYDLLQTALATNAALNENIDILEERWMNNRERIRLLSKGLPSNFMPEGKERNEVILLEVTNEDLSHYVHIKKDSQSSIKRDIGQLTRILKALPKEKEVTEHHKHFQSKILNR